MRMVAVRVHGYRRFEVKSTLDLTPRVVAIVGPNEAGKSSLLDALEQLTEPGAREFSDRDFSGWKRPDDNKRVLSALFEVEAEDHQAMADIPGASKIRLWELFRRADGNSQARLIPGLTRDQTKREKVIDDLERMMARKAKPTEEFLARKSSELITREEGEQEAEEQNEAEQSLAEITNLVLAEMQGEAETLGDETCSRLETLATALEYLPPDSPVYMQKLGETCSTLVAEHRAEHPNELAFSLLSARCPQVKVLRDADRQLQTGYRFEDYEEPPPPLANLLALAGVGWNEIKSAAAEPENPHLENLFVRANRKLNERLRGSWKQSIVSVRLSEQGGQLNVYPYDADSDSHSKIEERSDGFKSFLALLAFTTRHSIGQRKLVLGIDEAERHLHYDAQVDLVGVLTRQTFATQIIYTTHSAGCLPEDLGSAIRVISQAEGDRSTIINGFWSAQTGANRSVGFTSLLMAMGADAVAFTPARHAVITEGPSDALLLPALFRKAERHSPDTPLELQVAGGLASTPPRLLPRLEAEAAHVVYLTDSDKTGFEYAEALENAGVPRERIFRLESEGESGLSIEDFVDKDTYVEVVNLLLRELRDYEDTSFTVADVPDSGAAKAAERWAEEQGVEPLPKPAVAEHLLRLCGASLAYMYWDPDVNAERKPLLRENRREALLGLIGELRAALKISPEDNGTLLDELA